MRHGKKTVKLSRTASHRKAMFANMACSLIEHKRINTTTAKAKALRGYIEPLITKAKTDTTHNRRLAFKELRNKYAVSELFREIAPKVGDRPGGYTRVIKLGNRLGDNAEMAMIELVDFNETYNPSEGGQRKSTRRGGGRGRRRGGKKNAPAAEQATEQAPKAEKPKAEDTPVEKSDKKEEGEA